MKTLGISALKSSLQETLEQVKAGDSVLVTERGRAIARIVPVREGLDEAVLERMIRSGAIRPPLQPLDPSVWTLPRIDDPEGLLVRFVLEERGGRR